MRAGSADRKKLRPLSDHENRLAKRVPKKHSFIGHAVELAALFEIGSFKFALRFSHKNSFADPNWNRVAASMRAFPSD